MNNRRRLYEGTTKGMTIGATGIAVAVLLIVLIYVFRQGIGLLSLDLIRGNYWSENINIAFEEPAAKEFKKPADLPKDAYFSKKFGFALADREDPRGADLMTVVYIDPDSPLHTAYSTTAGATQGKHVAIHEEASIQRIQYLNTDGDKKTAGPARRMFSKDTIKALDESATELVLMYYQTEGGGIWGSIIATLILIGVTLVIVLPVGVAAAIYLNEVAGKNKLTAAIRSSIEMLSGVPSIIFGLMGMAMLFPVTQLFGANGPSILLGALTLAVVLLPVVIRQTEEALLVVPNGLRMGSLALGATQTQTIFRVVLPNALPGILTAALLSISRVIGESAALIYTMSTIISDSPSLLQPATSLAVQIWAITSAEQPNFELASAISILILAMVLVLNITVKIISVRLNRRWSA
ncbi:MAG: phosphate ABC transporter permease PstA [Bacillota bacterium]|nr:phosphate ABC transporter permease PstA [Bacillota bacterium]